MPIAGAAWRRRWCLPWAAQAKAKGWYSTCGVRLDKAVSLHWAPPPLGQRHGDDATPSKLILALACLTTSWLSRCGRRATLAMRLSSQDRSIRADIDDDRMSGGLAGSHSAASLVNSSRGAGPRGPLPSWPPPSAAKGGTNNIMQRDAHRKGGVEDKSRANHVVRPTLQQQQPARHCSRSIRIHYQTWCKAACFLWHRGRHDACRATRGAQLSPGLQ